MLESLREFADTSTSPLVSGMMRMQRAEVRRRRRTLNRATLTLGAMTASYLACNSLSVLVSVLERLPGQPWLLTHTQGLSPTPSAFYVVTTDLISFLFMFNSFLRLIIHMIVHERH